MESGSKVGGGGWGREKGGFLFWFCNAVTGRAVTPQKHAAHFRHVLKRARETGFGLNFSVAKQNFVS